MQLYFAHAGEVHEAATSSALHTILGRWYVALSVLFLVVFLAVKLVLFLTHGSRGAAYNVTLAIFLISGMGSYTLSAPVSVVSLSLGFAMALIQVLFTVGDTSSMPEKSSRP